MLIKKKNLKTTLLGIINKYAQDKPNSNIKKELLKDYVKTQRKFKEQIIVNAPMALIHPYTRVIKAILKLEKIDENNYNLNQKQQDYLHDFINALLLRICVYVYDDTTIYCQYILRCFPSHDITGNTESVELKILWDIK